MQQVPATPQKSKHPIKQCVACKLAIHAEANVCHHCHSNQMASPWQKFVTTVKWLGGGIAVVSLLLTMIQVNKIFNSWDNKQQALDQLIRMGEAQSHDADYEGAWRSYARVLEIEPGHKSAQDRQTDLAMRWLRDVYIKENQTYTEIVEQLLPVLYRGAVNRKGNDGASVYAHIAWANYLRKKENKISNKVVEQSFSTALQAGPRNAYVNAMYAFWLHYSGDRDLKRIRYYFDNAVQAGAARDFIRSLQFIVYDDDYSKEYIREMMAVVDSMRINREYLPKHLRDDMLARLKNQVRHDDALKNMLSVLPGNDAIKSLEYLLKESNEKMDDPIYTYMVAYIKEINGDTEGARQLYDTLAGKARSRYTSAAVKRAQARLASVVVSKNEADDGKI